MKALKSWKTTAGGILAGLAILIPQIQVLLGGGFGDVNWQQIAVGLGALGIGWFSRDNDKRSEEIIET